MDRGLADRAIHRLIQTDDTEYNDLRKLRLQYYTVKLGFGSFIPAFITNFKNRSITCSKMIREPLRNKLNYLKAKMTL